MKHVRKHDTDWYNQTNALMARYHGGEDGVLSVLLERITPDIHRIAMGEAKKLFPPEEVAHQGADAAQTYLLYLLEGHEKSSFSESWSKFTTYAHNYLSRAVEKQHAALNQKLPEGFDPSQHDYVGSDAVDKTSDPEQKIHRMQVNQLTRDVVGQNDSLGPRQLAVTRKWLEWLRQEEALTLTEIAERFGVSHNRVSRVRLEIASKIEAELRRHLGGEGPELQPAYAASHIAERSHLANSTASDSVRFRRHRQELMELLDVSDSRTYGGLTQILPELTLHTKELLFFAPLLDANRQCDLLVSQKENILGAFFKHCAGKHEDSMLGASHQSQISSALEGLIEVANSRRMPETRLL